MAAGKSAAKTVHCVLGRWCRMVRRHRVQSLVPPLAETSVVKQASEVKRQALHLVVTTKGTSHAPSISENLKRK